MKNTVQLQFTVSPAVTKKLKKLQKICGHKTVDETVSKLIEAYISSKMTK